MTVLVFDDVVWWCRIFHFSKKRVKRGHCCVWSVSLCCKKQVINVTASDLDEVHEAIVAVLQEVHTKLSQEESNI